MSRRSPEITQSSSRLRDDWEDKKERLGASHPDAELAHRRYLRGLADENRQWLSDREAPRRWERDG